MIRIDCLSTLGCAELDLDGAIALAARFGLRKVELRALAGRLDLPRYLAETCGSPAALADRLRDAQVSVPILDTSLSLQEPAAGARDDFLAFVPWAEAVRARHLRVFDGGIFGATMTPDELARAVETVRWWRELRSRHGWSVDIAVETHESLCASAEVLRLQERLEAPVPVLWDTWHTWFKAGEPPGVTWAALGRFVGHVHVKDGWRRPVRQFPYTYCLPGQGEFPFHELAPLLAPPAYAGSVSLEWERLWHPYLPPLDEALAALARNGP